MVEYLISMKAKYRSIIRELQSHARVGLKEISLRHDIPISTVHAIIQTIMPRFIIKYITLIDYPALGYHGQASIVIKAGQGRYQDMKEFLLGCSCINSLQGVNNGYHFLVEIVMRNQKDVHDILDDLERRFKATCKIFWILEDIKREEIKI